MKGKIDSCSESELIRQASQLTLGALIQSQVKKSPEAIALEQGEKQLSYAELAECTDRLCHWLLSKGIRRGDRVAILSENRMEYVELLVAGAKLGVIIACQNWRLANDELHHCVALVTPKLILVSARYADKVDVLQDIAPCVQFGPEYEIELDAAPFGSIQETDDPEDGVVILYTSGTTGLPKGALISQRAEIARAHVHLLDFPVASHEAFVAWAPLFHMISTDTVFMTLMIGGKVIVTDGYDADELALIAGRELLGRLTLMPGTVLPFLEALERNKIKPVGARWVGVMADLVPVNQIAEVTRIMNAPYINSFGSTETGFPPGTGASIPVGVVPQNLNKTQSSLCAIRLVDENGDQVADGEPGEVAVRSPALFSGYWNNSIANQEDFRKGWFHMGDVLIRNEDGTLSFVDRRKYLIKSGGENIYPAEIERVFLSEARVLDAVVVKKMDPTWGEIPVAMVVRKDDSLDVQFLVDLCRSRIAAYKVPKEIHFVELSALPRSATGKIMRQVLEKRLAQQQDI